MLTLLNCLWPITPPPAHPVNCQSSKYFIAKGLFKNDLVIYMRVCVWGGGKGGLCTYLRMGDDFREWTFFTQALMNFEPLDSQIHEF